MQHYTIAFDSCMQAIFRMRGGSTFGALNEDGKTRMTPSEAVEQLFEHLDKNGDEKLSDLEFILGAKMSPSILGLLQADHTQE